jgi:hypothetical protein
MNVQEFDYGLHMVYFYNGESDNKISWIMFWFHV